jgi:uncharacterized protein (TIGR03000 family)
LLRSITGNCFVIVDRLRVLRLLLQEVCAMYSVVLMMAVTSGGEVADLGRRGGCGGCSGCYGGCSGGCYGGGRGGRRGGRRHGCSGGCYGGGCYGGGYGGGCYGGGYGGCYGGVGYGGGCYGGAVASPPAGKPSKQQKSGKEEEQKGDQEQETMSPQSAPARITVRLPENARLTVDGEATQSTSSVRTFVSPALPPGKVFYYTLKAEFSRAGQPVSVSKKVKVQAGRNSQVDLDRVEPVLARR